MALYEYVCESCEKGKPFRFEVRMPMRDVVQLTPCPRCGRQAKKAISGFAVVGIAKPGFGDGPPPWEGGDSLGDDDPMAGHGHDHAHGHDHGHSHGPGGLDLNDDF